MANEITWKLEHEKISRLLLHYAIPAVIGTMVNALYNIVDRIFIGQGVGALAMAGLTLTFPILLFLQAFGMLVGAGAATRISIYLGRKDNRMAEKVLGNAFTLTFLITALTVAPCMIWMNDLLQAFGGSEQTIPWIQRRHACFRIPQEGDVHHADWSDCQRHSRPDFHFLVRHGNPRSSHCDGHLHVAWHTFCNVSFCTEEKYRPFPAGNIRTGKKCGMEYFDDWNFAFRHAADGKFGRRHPERSAQAIRRRFGAGGKRHYHKCHDAHRHADYRNCARDAAYCGIQLRSRAIQTRTRDVATGHHHLDGYHGYWMCGKRRFPGMDCKCFHTRRGFTGCDRQWSTNHIARIHCRRFTNFDQPILPKHWYCMESDIPQFESSIAVSGACDITLFPRVGARWGLVCRTILRLRGSSNRMDIPLAAC